MARVYVPTCTYVRGVYDSQVAEIACASMGHQKRNEPERFVSLAKKREQIQKTRFAAFADTTPDKPIRSHVKRVFLNIEMRII